MEKIKPRHGFCGTQFYSCWKNIKTRCNNKKQKPYKNYGGRGITYDKRWEKFENFLEDMYFKYIYSIKQLKLKIPSIERKDVNGNYNFNNCIFINKPDQNKNTRCLKKFKAISPDRKIYFSKNQHEFSKKFNLDQKHISDCLLKKRKHHKKWRFFYV
jgi:hypothetical protein